jgi:hypothetical protein
VRVVLASVVGLAACYNEAAVTPCTLTCEDSSCPAGLECMSDQICQTPGMPICSTITGDGGGGGSGIYIKSTPANAGARFGTSVALSFDGNTLAVGAPGERFGGKSNAGAVYVFAWDGTKYTLLDRVVSQQADADDQFGASVALSNDGMVLAVGVPGEDSGATGVNGDEANNAAPDSGAVFVYTRSGSTITKSKYLKFGTTATNAFYGTAVALSGDGKLLAVTAPGPGNTLLSVLRWTLSSNTAPEAHPTMAEVDDRVGASVAMPEDGSAVFAGASLDDTDATGFTNNPAAPNNAMPDSGAMWYLGYSALYRFYFKPSNTGANDNFGTAIASSSSAAFLAVGAPLEDSNGTEANNSVVDSGAVYLFDEPSTLSWLQSHYFKAPAPATGDHFGQSVSLAGDGTLLVSGTPGRAGGGAAFVFEQATLGTWSAGPTLVGFNTEQGDEFGSVVAVSRNRFVIAVGAPGEAGGIVMTGGPPDPNNNSAPGAGAVYVFR